MKKLFLLILLLPVMIFGLEFDEAKFLLNRTCFGASRSDINALENLSYEKAVTNLIKSASTTPKSDYPKWKGKFILQSVDWSKLSAEEKKVLKKLRRQRGKELQKWWLNEMAVTDSPLTEKMTLFWHNHFTSELGKVKWPSLMLDQNILFRKYALGSFADMLRDIAKDPAMIVYLDNRTNKKSHPNENFARELMELFTLGEGHYTEKDIKEAARAFTGWTIDLKTGKFKFNRRVHDFGEKTFLGESGNFDGDDIIEIILKQERTAEFITEKFYKEFISYNINQDEVKRIAKIFKESDYQIKTLLYEILTSDDFKDKSKRDLLIKSPVELVIGTSRTFNEKTVPSKQFFKRTKNMGQEVLNPPNVKGWQGKKEWMSTNYLMERRNFLKKAGRVLKRKYKKSSKYSIEELKQLLLPVEASTQITDRKNRFSAVLLDPAYELK